MTDTQIFEKINKLDPALKQEVNDFIDFLLKKNNSIEEKNIPQFGCARGKFKMSPDFDEPLEDLKEYM